MDFKKIAIADASSYYNYSIETSKYSYGAVCGSDGNLIINPANTVGIKLFRVNPTGRMSGVFENDFIYGTMDHVAKLAISPVDHIAMCSYGYHFYTLDQFTIHNSSISRHWVYDKEIIPFAIIINTPFVKASNKSVCSNFKILKSLDLTKKTLISHYPGDHHEFNKFINKYLKKASDRLSNHYLEFNNFPLSTNTEDVTTYFEMLKDMSYISIGE